MGPLLRVRAWEGDGIFRALVLIRHKRVERKLGAKPAKQERVSGNAAAEWISFCYVRTQMIRSSQGIEFELEMESGPQPNGCSRRIHFDCIP